MRRFAVTCCLLIPLLLLGAGAGAAAVPGETVSDIIRRKVADIRRDTHIQVHGTWIASHAVLPLLYETRGFRPVWTDPMAVDQLVAAVEKSAEDGLRPMDYHFDELSALRARIARTQPPPELLADFDLLLSDSLIRLGYHLMFGKENPATHHPQWNLPARIDNVDPADMLLAVIESCSIGPMVEDCMPRHPVYDRMKAALARHREIQASGGWQPVAPGPTLEKGMTDERVVQLRLRLAVTGDLSPAAAGSPHFDGELARAVAGFQARHRLNPDGRAGRHTLRELNVPVQQRIDTVRVALERLRWVLRGVPRTFVVADIAHFEAAYFRDGRRLWSARTQVGTPFRETPVFRSDITYLVFNPTWTIPPTVMEEDILPSVIKNRGYLRERNIRVLDGGGRALDPEAIDWENFAGGRFPYQLRQDPGPQNALGRVKFMLPNPYHVYLHDTPSRALFEQENRAFSSGCIRIENPLELARLLLNDPLNWSAEKIAQAVAGGETRTVRLPVPVPVLLLYSTAWVDEAGTAYFTRDVYGRDPAVLKGLDSAFRIEHAGGDSRPAI